MPHRRSRGRVNAAAWSLAAAAACAAVLGEAARRTVLRCLEAALAPRRRAASALEAFSSAAALLSAVLATTAASRRAARRAAVFSPPPNAWARSTALAAAVRAAVSMWPSPPGVLGDAVLPFRVVRRAGLLWVVGPRRGLCPLWLWCRWRLWRLLGLVCL